MFVGFARCAIAALALGLAGCASTSEFGTAPSVQVTDMTELPVPPVAAPMTLGAGDTVEVGVFGFDDLSGTFVIDEAGTLDYPLAGRISATGRSTGQLSTEIAARLRGDYVVNPIVTVTSDQTATVAPITVGGSVNRPGRFASDASLGLMEAVAMAGGTAEFAKTKEVFVFRTVGDQRYLGIFDLAAIERGNAVNPRIYPADTIMVDDSATRRVIENTVGIVTTLLAPILLIDRLAN